ncbi:hypothetical protein MVEN_02013000 [Mycena venus]|uniref:Uncharacterized protein n=1 Tax=Mycena venus TaxID=2733690 RepID=A0A8H7CHJ7_9AGAR|nr:hypothetical protein MVEN_02013000 [Mycena venus]
MHRASSCRSRSRTQGRTTYAVEQDAEAGGSTRTLTATLVEGTDYVFYTLSHTASSESIIVGFDCGLKNGKAICSGTNANAQPQTATVPSLGTLVLDVVSTAAPSGPTSAASSNPTSVDPSSPSSSPNSSLRMAASIPVALSGVLLAGLRVALILVYSIQLEDTTRRLVSWINRLP